MIMKQFLAIGLASILTWGLMGCETMREHKTASGATIGAVAGGVAGGLIGKQSGHTGAGAAIGAATGAALGGGIGYWMDRQAKKYDAIEDVQVEKVPETQAATTTGSAAPTPAHVTLRLSSELLFDRDASALKPAGDQKLREIAQAMNEDKDSKAVIKGYASADGADDHNLRLSENRAKMVANTLIGYGVDPSRITSLGMGESNSIGDNATEAGRVQNRRVEIEIYPKAAAQ